MSHWPRTLSLYETPCSNFNSGSYNHTISKKAAVGKRERTDENYILHNSRSAILLSICVCVCVCVFSGFQLLVTPWIIASQALLSMEFSRQEYWNGLPFSYSSLSICTYPKNVNLSHFTSLASYYVFLNNLIKLFKCVL